jgi:hypothetical protein
MIRAVTLLKQQQCNVLDYSAAMCTVALRDEAAHVDFHVAGIDETPSSGGLSPRLLKRLPIMNHDPIFQQSKGEKGVEGEGDSWFFGVSAGPERRDLRIRSGAASLDQAAYFNIFSLPDPQQADIAFTLSTIPAA